MLELIEKEPEDKRADWNKEVRIVTMRELGPRLPIGTVDPATGALQKEMQHRRWNLKMEKAIGKYRDENRRASMGRFTSIILTKLCSQLGSFTLTGEDASIEREALSVNSLFMGDVLYAYFWLRRQALGPIVEFQIACTRCDKRATVPADLDTLEVRTVEDLEHTRWVYELIDPITIREVEVKRLLMQPPRWAAIQSMPDFGLNTGSMKAGMIVHSIAGVEELENAVIVEHELDEMSKRDVERLSAEIERKHLGPDVAVETQCDKCKNEIRVSIDWGYDVFFSDSGRSAR